MTSAVSHATLHAPAMARTTTSLSWSEQMILLCATLSMLVVVSRFVWPLERLPYFEHVAFLLTVPLFVLSLIGQHLSASRAGAARSGIWAVAWPFAALVLIIVSGSGYARFVNGVQESFLNMGLYMSLVFMGAALVIRSNAPQQLVRAFCRILLGGAFLMAIGLIVYFGRREVYHEEIFLIIPMAVYGFLAFRSVLMRWGTLVFFLSMALLSVKITSYLVSLMTLAYLGMLVWLPAGEKVPPLLRIWRYYVAFVVFLVSAVGVAYLFHYRDVYLPSGNVDYRHYAYGMAWQRFLESPWWGTLFAVSGVQKFPLYAIGVARNVLPTHSDIMDLLANGGVFGIGLWALGLIRIGRRAYRGVLAPRWRSHPSAPYGHTLAMLSLAAVATYAFNPIMLQPAKAYLMWLSLGFLLGLALRNEASSLVEDKYHAI